MEEAAVQTSLVVLSAISATLFLLVSCIALIVLKQQRKEARDQKAMIQSVLDTHPHMCFVKDLNGRMIMVNSTFERVTGIDRNAILGAVSAEFLIEEDQKCFKADEAFVLKTKEPAVRQYDIPCPQGYRGANYLTVELTIAPCVLGNAVIGTLCVGYDISERLNQESVIRYYSTHDHLTTLPNRKAFERKLSSLIEDTYHHLSAQYCVMNIRIDNFREFNELHGRDIGDIALVHLSSLLKGIRPESDLCRIGGNSFGMVMQVHTQQSAIDVANNIAAVIQTPFTQNKKEYSISAGIGIAIFPSHGQSPTELIQNTEVALKSASPLAKGAVVLYEDKLNVLLEKKNYSHNRIHQALQNGEFFLVYQPIFDLARRKILGKEALLRWNDPRFPNPLRPDQFLPAAQSSRLLDTLGQWAIEEALKECSAEHQKTGVTYSISLNIFISQLEKISFCDWLIGVIYHYQVDPSQIMVDVSEVAFTNVSKGLKDRLNQLAMEGIRIYVDDFKAAESSPLVLKDLPISGVKIDSAFVEGVANNERNQTRVQTLIQIANASTIHKDIIAEGVSSDRDVDFLISLGVKAGQGNYLAPPGALQAQRPAMLSDEPSNVVKLPQK